MQNSCALNLLGEPPLTILIALLQASMPATKVCKCVSHGCGLKEYVNELGSTCSGVHLSVKEFSTHVKDDKAAQRFNLLAASHGDKPHTRGPDTATSIRSEYSSKDMPVETGSIPTVTHPGVEPESSSISRNVLAQAVVYFDCLDRIKKELEQRQTAFTLLEKLIFVEPPVDTLVASKSLSQGLFRSPNGGPLQLRFAAPENATFLLYESWIADQVREVHNITTNSTCSPELVVMKDGLLSDLILEWDRLDRIKKDEFGRQEGLRLSGDVMRMGGRRVLSTRKKPCSSD